MTVLVFVPMLYQAKVHKINGSLQSLQQKISPDIPCYVAIFLTCKLILN